MCTLAIAAMAVSAISAYQNAEAQNAQARYNAAVYDSNAKVSEAKAVDAQARGEQEAIANNRRAAQLRGTQRALMAGRGLDLGFGTAQAVLDQTDYFGAVDTQTIRGNADKESWAHTVEADNFRTRAAASRASQVNPLMAAGTSLLTSASMVDKKWMPAAKTTSGEWGSGGWGTPPYGGTQDGVGFKRNW